MDKGCGWGQVRGGRMAHFWNEDALEGMGVAILVHHQHIPCTHGAGGAGRGISTQCSPKYQSISTIIIIITGIITIYLFSTGQTSMADLLRWLGHAAGRCNDVMVKLLLFAYSIPGTLGPWDTPGTLGPWDTRNMDGHRHA